MINLTKKPKPTILINKGVEWTNKLLGHIKDGSEIPDGLKSNYRHPEIKNAVKEETKCKCVYCESMITHQYPGDVEHIIPKSVYPRLTFTWNNLSFVCYWCNNNKRATIDKLCKLLNPYRDNIDLHLQAFGPMIMHINNSKRGELTWREIKLNRKELIDRRVEAIKDLQNLIDKYHSEHYPSLKEILHMEILDNVDSDKEYSLFKKQFVHDQGLI